MKFMNTVVDTTEWTAEVVEAVFGKEPIIYCYAFGTAEECPDCLNNSCYEPCKAEGGVKND